MPSHISDSGPKEMAEEFFPEGALDTGLVVALIVLFSVCWCGPAPGRLIPSGRVGRLSSALEVSAVRSVCAW